MAKVYKGAISGRTAEIEGGEMMGSYTSSHANMPQEVMMKNYKSQEYGSYVDYPDSSSKTDAVVASELKKVRSQRSDSKY